MLCDSKTYAAHGRYAAYHTHALVRCAGDRAAGDQAAGQGRRGSALQHPSTTLGLLMPACRPQLRLRAMRSQAWRELLPGYSSFWSCSSTKLGYAGCPPAHTHRAALGIGSMLAMWCGRCGAYVKQASEGLAQKVGGGHTGAHRRTLAGPTWTHGHSSELKAISSTVSAACADRAFLVRTCNSCRRPSLLMHTRAAVTTC